MKRKLSVIVFAAIALAAGLTSCEKIFNPTYEDVPPDATTVRSISTIAPVKVTTTTADLRGSITLFGDGVVIERGIFLTNTSNPLIPQPGNELAYSGQKFQGQITDGDNFTVSLTGLKPDTKYRYIAYATTMGGTIYGEVKTLVTSYGTVEDAEGNVYQTVKVGDQEWMRENLRSTLYSDKAAISGMLSNGDDSKYGKHYTYDAANRITGGVKAGPSNGVCPVGWHVPTDSEFQTLLKYVGVPADQISLGLFGDCQATQLKDAGPEYWANQSIENGTGFSILPAGICNPDAGDECFKTAFWTSDPYIFYAFEDECEMIFRGNDEPDCKCGISIRCIKD